MEAACVQIVKNCHVSEWSSLAHSRITTPFTNVATMRHGGECPMLDGAKVQTLQVT